MQLGSQNGPMDLLVLDNYNLHHYSSIVLVHNALIWWCVSQLSPNLRCHFSSNTGQFLHQSAEIMDTPEVDPHNGRLKTRLSFKGPHSKHRTLLSHLWSRRNMEDDKQVPCWHVNSNAAGLLKGSPLDYVVSHISQRHSSLHHLKQAKRMQLPLPRVLWNEGRLVWQQRKPSCHTQAVWKRAESNTMTLGPLKVINWWIIYSPCICEFMCDLADSSDWKDASKEHWSDFTVCLIMLRFSPSHLWFTGMHCVDERGGRKKWNSEWKCSTEWVYVLYSKSSKLKANVPHGSQIKLI